jgi:signal transduction histidine kinase
VVAPIADALGSDYVVSASAAGSTLDPFHLRLHLQLRDGTPLTVEMSPSQLPLSIWVPLVVLAQLATLAFVTWLAVRLATRPLAQLAGAADALSPELRNSPLPEDGPLEVARAATAFNAMQRRITDYLAERAQLLAAISHDLQTPITRMRLRAELMDDASQRDKLYGDLNAMQVLVEEGIAYARGVRGVTEAPCRIDLHALLDSLVCDYADAGKPVRLSGRFDGPMTTRPHTLRRIIINVVENALKFGKDPEIVVDAEPSDRVSIRVRDRGPGIPESELHSVLQPFYRVEGSRNRDTGGTGLGLAIAQQLTAALSGTLALSNRGGGGLEVRLSLPSQIDVNGRAVE